MTLELGLFSQRQEHPTSARSLFRQHGHLLSLPVWGLPPDINRKLDSNHKNAISREKWYCSKNAQLTFKIRLASDLQAPSGILSLERSQMCHWRFWTPAFPASMSFLPAHGSTLISALWTFQAFETCRWNEIPAVISADSSDCTIPPRAVGRWPPKWKASVVPM